MGKRYLLYFSYIVEIGSPERLIVNILKFYVLNRASLKPCMYTIEIG